MDGYEATRQIRKLEIENCEQCADSEASEELFKCFHHHLPIVAVTADVMNGTHELCFDAGMDDYISKVRFNVSSALILSININTIGSSIFYLFLSFFFLFSSSSSFLQLAISLDACNIWIRNFCILE